MRAVTDKGYLLLDSTSKLLIYIASPGWILYSFLHILLIEIFEIYIQKQLWTNTFIWRTNIIEVIEKDLKLSLKSETSNPRPSKNKSGRL